MMLICCSVWAPAPANLCSAGGGLYPVDQNTTLEGAHPESPAKVGIVHRLENYA